MRWTHLIVACVAASIGACGQAAGRTDGTLKPDAASSYPDGGGGTPEAGGAPSDADGPVPAVDAAEGGCPATPSPMLDPDVQTSVSIRDYGAVPDDTNDDAVAIQAAVDAAPDGAGVLFPAGVYRISHTLLFRSHHAYIGQTGTVLHFTGPANHFLVTDPGAALSDVIIQRIAFDGSAVAVWGDRITVRGCTFENNSNTQFGPDHGLFIPNYMTDSQIVGNHFANVIGNGTDSNGIMSYGLDHVEITDNTFDDVYQGMHLSLDVPGKGTQVTIARNVAHRLHRMGIEVQGSNASGLRIEDNTLTDWGTVLADGGNRIALSIVPIGGTGIHVAGNRLVGGTDTTWGMELGGSQMIVELNYVEGFVDGIAISTAPGIIVRQNTVVRSLDSGIHPYHAGDLSPGIVISNNDLRDVKKTAIGTDGERTPGIVIQDNFVMRTAGAFPDDATTQFVAVNAGPTGTSPMKVLGNVIVQAAAHPVAGFSFVGIGSNGYMGNAAGMVVDGNTVASLSLVAFGTGIFGNAPGGHTGVSYTNDWFQGLAAALGGTIASQGGVFTAAGNVVVDGANDRADLAAVEYTVPLPSAQMSITPGPCADSARRLDASGSVGVDSPASSFRWWFGDGASDQGARVGHVYPRGVTSSSLLLVKTPRGAVGLTATDVVTSP